MRLRQQAASRAVFLGLLRGLVRTAVGDRIPLRNPTDQLRVIVISNERPALLVAVRAGRARPLVLDERLGVFEVAVDSLDGRLDAVFLRLSSTRSRCSQRQQDTKGKRGEQVSGKEPTRWKVPCGSARPARAPGRSCARCAWPPTARAPAPTR